MVLLLYIQNQDKQKMTKKNQIKFPEKKKIKTNSPKKKKSESYYYPKQPQKSLKNYKKFCHTPQFFFTSNEQDTRKKKITKRKQLSCKIQGNTKSKLTRKTKILQKNPMKYTHKKVELKKKKIFGKKPLLPFSFFAVQQLVKLT